MTAASWTEDRVTMLKQLLSHPERLSAAEIAIQLGGGITRNAVIGKALRLKIELPNKVSRKPRGTTMPVGSIASKVLHGIKRRKRESAHPSLKPEPFLCQDAADVVPLNLDIMALTEATCRWPYGGDGAPVVYCGHLPYGGRSYCLSHYRLSIGDGTPSERAAHQVSRMVA